MACYGNSFIFDGISCTEYGLMIYDFNNYKRDADVIFTSTGTINEEKISRKYSSLFYGLTQNDSLEFTLVFGVASALTPNRKSLDRYDISAITSWLTGHNERKWLEIEGSDMNMFRYKCVISELQLVTEGWEPWAFQCKVTCDSPFAYLYPEDFTYSISSGGGNISDTILNVSAYNGYYKPQIALVLSSEVHNITIENLSDHGRIFSFTDLPPHEGDFLISADNESQIIKSNPSINLYKYFNFNFFRLIRGENHLKISSDGACEVKIICEFPVNVGG